MLYIVDGVAFVYRFYVNEIIKEIIQKIQKIWIHTIWK